MVAKTITCPNEECGFIGFAIPNMVGDGYICVNCGLDIPKESLVNSYNRKCNHVWLLTKEGRSCINCGIVDDLYIPVWPPRGENHAKGATYKRVFYFHEKLSQFNQSEPQIPKKLLKLLDISAKEFQEKGEWKEGEQICYSTIREICKNVGDDSNNENLRKKFSEISPNFRSEKFKKRPLRNLLKYAEKWVTLNARWSKFSPKPFTPAEYQYLHNMYIVYDNFFDRVRHNEGCKNKYFRDKGKCHKSKTKCRFAMVSINLLVKTFLSDYKKKGKITKMRYNEILTWWPQLANNKTKTLDSKYLSKIRNQIISNRNLNKTTDIIRDV